MDLLRPWPSSIRPICRLLTVVVILAAAPALFAGCPDFNLAPLYDAGPSSAAQVAVADFNNDGNDDLAVVNGGGAVSILLNNGDGSFGAPISATAAGYPDTIVAADVDGNGNMDAVISDRSMNSIQVFRGNGDGTLDPLATYTSGSDPAHIVAGDFNEDGSTDIATSNFASSNVSVFLSNGDGTFTAAANYSAGSGSYPSGFVVADFNGDGHQDLAVADSGNYSYQFYVLMGTGNGTFSGAIANSSGARPNEMVAGDFNGDGHPDLAVAHLFFALGSDIYFPHLSIYLNDGSGGFGFAASYSEVPPRKLGTSDFNSDGILDLAVASGGDVVMYRGNGDGTFAFSSKAYVAGNNFSGPAIGDLNGDGHRDVVAGVSPAQVTILAGNGDGTFVAPPSYLVGPGASAVGLGDFDGDLRPDLVAANNGISTRYGRSEHWITIMLQTESGDFSMTPIARPRESPSAIAVSDFNNDGKLDFAVAAELSSSIDVFLGFGNGSFQTAVATADSDAFAIGATDFNNDGVEDLAAATKLNRVSVLIGVGDGTFLPPLSFAAGTRPVAIALGDFDGDGNSDAAVSNESSSNVSVLLGDGTGALATAVNYPVGGFPKGIAAADLNGDSHLDLAVAAGGDVWVLPGNGDGTFAPALTFDLLVSGWSIVVADITGDAKPDLVVTASGGGFSVLPGVGDGTFGVARYFAVGGAGGIASGTAVGDVDGDGRPDVIASHVSVFLNRTGAAALTITTPASTPPGAAAVSATVADHSGSSYAWTVTGGTITSGQGTASIQYTAGTAGTRMTLSVTEMTVDGCASTGTTRVMVDFLDVPPSHPFHEFIVTLARNGITGGCGGGNYCPSANVLRSQMAVFLERGEHGEAYAPPAATGIFADVPVPWFFADFIEQLYNEGITGGCGTDPLRYCPSDSVLRSQMAIFLLRAKHGAEYVPPPATGIFADVDPAASFGADFIEQLYNEGITGGCATNPLRYCPNDATNRASMAVFLTRAFNLP